MMQQTIDTSASTFTCGLDLGQSQDYTALAIIQKVERIITPEIPPRLERVEHAPHIPERVRRLGLPMPAGLPTVVEERVMHPGQRGETRSEYHVRYLHRFELGTSYPDIIAHTLALLNYPELRGRVVLVLDRTGVGRAAYDLFAEAKTRAPIIPITITGGDVATRDDDGSGGYHVPKKDLASLLAILAQARPARLQFVPSLLLTDIVKAELANFQVKINARGHASYEAGDTAGGLWRDGAHDDLVLSCALGVWYAEHIGGSGPRFRFFD